MWNLSIQHKNAYEQAHVLTLVENDAAWADEIAYAQEQGLNLLQEKNRELMELRDYLLSFLPQRFHTYVLDGTMNTPQLAKAVREDYLKWQKQHIAKFDAVLEAAYHQKVQTLPYLKNIVREVFEQSLHDTRIVDVERLDHHIKLTIDTTGGFTTKSIIFLTFTNIVMESGELVAGQYYVYDELQKTANGIALRVTVDCPETEWTIEAKDIDADYYYRPKAYYDFKENDDFELYMQTLQLEQGLLFLAPQVKSKIMAIHKQSPFLQLEEGNLYVNENGVFVGDRRVADQLGDCIHFIHTAVYEDPYAHFSEPVPIEVLEEAALGNDLELKVRAWNTMYANPEELAPIIQRILTDMLLDEEDMMQCVYVNHFNKERVLTEELQLKYKSIID
ncbi:DUF4085 family protein [Lysinibacillus sphaericus]|uniref:DUF4085 family protein n=1 Tax=Lysinibacillus sphaericus TaxID=1421 RepID=UPI003F7AA0F8